MAKKNQESRSVMSGKREQTRRLNVRDVWILEVSSNVRKKNWCPFSGQYFFNAAGAEDAKLERERSHPTLLYRVAKYKPAVTP